jgi:hypothetical protein
MDYRHSLAVHDACGEGHPAVCRLLNPVFVPRTRSRGRRIVGQFLLEVEVCWNISCSSLPLNPRTGSDTGNGHPAHKDH